MERPSIVVLLVFRKERDADFGVRVVLNPTQLSRHLFFQDLHQRRVDAVGGTRVRPLAFETAGHHKAAGRAQAGAAAAKNPGRAHGVAPRVVLMVAVGASHGQAHDGVFPKGERQSVLPVPLSECGLVGENADERGSRKHE